MSSSLENNKQVVRDFIERVINQRKLSTADEYFSKDLKWHGWSNFQSLDGLDSFVSLLEDFFAGFPDLRVSMEDIIAEDDKVVLRWTWTGTHRGTFEGVKPTEKRVRVIGIGVFRLEDGKIVERWLVEDFLDLMEQLGQWPRKESS